MDQFNLLNSMVSQTRKMWTEQMMKIFILHRGSWQRDMCLMDMFLPVSMPTEFWLLWYLMEINEINIEYPF